MTKTYIVKYPEDNRFFEVWFKTGAEQDTAVAFSVDGFLDADGEWYDWPVVVNLSACEWFGDFDEAVEAYWDEVYGDRF